MRLDKTLLHHLPYHHWHHSFFCACNFFIFSRPTFALSVSKLTLCSSQLQDLDKAVWCWGIKKDDLAALRSCLVHRQGQCTQVSRLESNSGHHVDISLFSNRNCLLSASQALHPPGISLHPARVHSSRNFLISSCTGIHAFYSQVFVLILLPNCIQHVSGNFSILLYDLFLLSKSKKNLFLAPDVLKFHIHMTWTKSVLILCWVLTLTWTPRVLQFLFIYILLILTHNFSVLSF